MMLTEVQNVDAESAALELRDQPMPQPRAGEIRVRVSACGVCHTELDEIEGRTRPPHLPVVPGHEIVGTVDALGPGARRHAQGDRVGVGWFYDSCGRCDYCERGLPNLCESFRATGRDANGGYAEYLTVPERSAYPIPDAFGDTEAAPLLCAGGVGYRALALSGMEDGRALGFYGFGASAHLVIQMARHEYPNARICVFTRSRSKESFARELGADWAGEPGSDPPVALDAIIDTTPVWTPLEQGLRVLAPGGRFVINAIRKRGTDKAVLAQLEYERHLWMEKEIKSVANVTPHDVRSALRIAAEIAIKPTVTTYPLEEANRALADLKEGKGHGALVLVVR
jgi:propanol-preferring alcohol dehydrogenase